MITKFTPVTDFNHINKVFDQLFTESTRQRPNTTTMPIDIIEQDGNLIVKASLPGLTQDQIEINIEENILTITGEHTTETETNEEKIYRREIATGKFTRSLRLSDDIDYENAQASFANGIVTITFPLFEEEKPKTHRINITSDASLN